MERPRPNLLVLFAEQHRGDCLSSAGHPVLMTPNIDQIGGRGTRFTSAYATCPVCVPARRSLISGQFPATHGARANIHAEWECPNTFARVLRDEGYQTAWIGRSMHQQPPRKRFGFEEMVISGTAHDDDYHAFLARQLPEGAAPYWQSGVMHNDWTARTFHLSEHLHHTNWTIHEAQEFLRRRDPTRPFCLVVSFIASHPPLIPPEFYFNRYVRTGVPDPVIGDWAEPPPGKGIGDGVAPAGPVQLEGEALLSARAAYYGLINHMDDQIRRLLNPYPASLGDTAVVYAADHGEMLGDHYLWRKSVPYEGSAHIPMLIHAPPSFGFPGGQVLDQPVCLEDLMPTLLDFAGAAIPETVEGRSLVPLLAGRPDAAWREFVHVECAPHHHTLTDGREKFIWFAADGREQFFRLSDDPMECHDLAARPEEAERVAVWRKRLVAHLADRPEGFSDGRRLLPGRPYPADGSAL